MAYYGGDPGSTTNSLEASELEFQSFMLSENANSQSPLAPMGSMGAHPGGIVPPPVNDDGGGSQNQQQNQGGTSAFWTLAFYARFFDVDTMDVLGRMRAAVLPTRNFLDVISANPDLYGPFWISTTLIFLLFVSSTIAGSIDALISDDYKYVYDVEILTKALPTVYTYVFAMATVCWALSRWFKVGLKWLEWAGLFGYGLTIWIPLSVLCVIPAAVVSRWLWVSIGFVFAVVFKTRTTLPYLRSSEANQGASPTTGQQLKVIPVFLFLIVASNLALALLFKFLFFN